MKYYPMAMHLHSIHQPGASMAGHMYNAKSLGMKYIHFTDHDTRTGRKSVPVEGYDFSKGALSYFDTADEGRGWRTVGAAKVDFEGGELVLSSSDGSLCGISFYSDGKRHTWALLSEIILTFGFTFTKEFSDKIVFDVTLSQRPPEHKEAHFVYVIGEVSQEPSHLRKEVEMPKPEGDVYRLNITRDIEGCPELGGLDNVFSTVSVYVDGNASIRLNKFEIENKYEYNDIILKQRALAEEIGKSYGITPFVTTEISGGGQHKNCFSSSVPVINYFERGYKISEEEACEYLRSYGAVFSYNHPFEADRYKRKAFTREQIDQIIALETEYLAENRVFGAACMEVGFPEGRGLFTLADYLRLWDNLAQKGVFITGDGDSDSHYSDRSWFDKNNFATWIAADEKSEYPISEEAFNKSLISGDCYMGDPTRFKGEIEFHSGEYRMGSVIRAYESSYELTLRMTGLRNGQTVKIIKNGELFSSVEIEEAECETTLTVVTDNPITFVRAELYDTDGRCIMLTNPIYFVDPYYKGEISSSRAGYFGTSRQKNDDDKMNGIYEKEIDLPEWINNIKGKKVLHIGDTESWRYPIYKKLIEETKPDIIIHTGDLSDEVKAGRMSEVREEYVYKISVLCRMLRESVAELIVVPGNNDLSEEIKKLLPSAIIVGNDQVVEIDGVECRVGHQVHSMTFDKKWTFYGHGFTGDEWEPSANKENRELRFNACHGPTVCSLSDKRFHTFMLEDL